MPLPRDLRQRGEAAGHWGAGEHGRAAAVEQPLEPAGDRPLTGIAHPLHAGRGAGGHLADGLHRNAVQLVRVARRGSRAAQLELPPHGLPKDVVCCSRGVCSDSGGDREGARLRREYGPASGFYYVG